MSAGTAIFLRVVVVSTMPSWRLQNLKDGSREIGRFCGTAERGSGERIR
jgi:hypothetical protein